MNIIQSAHIKKAISYEAYRNMLDELMANNKTTGDNQSEDMVQYAQLNIQRMKRLDKTIQLSESFIQAIQKIDQNQIWLVLTEGWCGDAAQSVPVIAKMAEQNPHIELKILLRDENLDVMDEFLTNGGRSIPKLICLEKSSLEVLWEWGPRPQEAQKMVMEHKNNPKEDYKTFVEQIHLWYTRNKGMAIQEEILQKIAPIAVNS